jgi:hypothetical protein
MSSQELLEIYIHIIPNRNIFRQQSFRHIEAEGERNLKIDNGKLDRAES